MVNCYVEAWPLVLRPQKMRAWWSLMLHTHLQSLRPWAAITSSTVASSAATPVSINNHYLCKSAVFFPSDHVSFLQELKPQCIYLKDRDNDGPAIVTPRSDVRVYLINEHVHNPGSCKQVLFQHMALEGSHAVFKETALNLSLTQKKSNYSPWRHECSVFN